MLVCLKEELVAYQLSMDKLQTREMAVRGRAVAHQSEGRWFDSGLPGLHVEASLGKTLNPTLPTNVSIGVCVCMNA